MRPNTVAEACRRIEAGEPWGKGHGGISPELYLADSVVARVAMLAQEPPLIDDARHDALVGAIAEYLYKRSTPNDPPCWVGNRNRYLDEPWFPGADENDAGLREYLTFASPAEFKSRNIMTDDEPLRRATTGICESG